MRTERLLDWIARCVGRLVSRWGVDAEQYRWLLQASIRMDFRTQSIVVSKSETSSTKSALKWTLIWNFLFSFFMGIGILIAGADTFFFSVVLLGYGLVMVGMSILIEFGLVVISPDDFLILAPRPISSRTFFAVKLSNLCFYVLLLSLSLNAVPAVLGLACANSPWHFPVVYLTVAIVAALFVAGAIAAIYGLLLRKIDYDRFKDLLMYCQLAFSFLFFFGYQLVPRVAGRVSGVTIETLWKSWAVLIPSVWFAGLVELGLGHMTWQGVVLGGVALGTVGVLLPAVLKSVSLDYSEKIGRMMSASERVATRATERKRPIVARVLDRLWLRNIEERAFFYFLIAMFRRNRVLKLQLFSNLGVVFAMLAVALLQKGGLRNPLRESGFEFAATLPAMATLLGATGMATQLPYSDEYQGGWIFELAPVVQRKRVLKAVMKAAACILFAPLFLITSVSLSFFWPIHHALLQGLYALFLGVVSFQMLLFKFKDFPLSRKLEKGAHSARLAVFIMTMFLFTLVFVLPQLFARKEVALLVTIAVLALTSVLLGWWNNRVYARRKPAPV